MNKLQLINHLRKLGNGEIQPRHSSYGLCSEVGDYIPQWELITHFKTWGKFSGNLSYPIQVSGAPRRDYNHHIELWGDDKYGDRRRELCLHIADEMEKEL